jgi:hypothetical protein
MRTTLDIEDDVYLYARERAAQERTSIGRVVSALIRSGLSQSGAAGAGAQAADVSQAFTWVNGFPVVVSPAGSQRVVSNALIEQIREAEGI